MIGETVGGYRLTQKLGEGGTGETYLAEHAQSGQKAAIKILFPQMCTDAALIGRLFADVKAASLVNHSGIADLYDCGVLPSGRAYLILEHLQGRTLTDALIELGQVSDMESLSDISWQLATMLRGAHEAGVVHAALKPDGVFLTFPPGQAPRPLVKLLDFGMANFRLGVRHSQTGSLLGAPLYMSPEIGRGLGTVDHRADIYSLGCIMFEMACGRPPFVREGQGELIVAHATEPAPFVSSLEPSIPPALDQLIGRMLTKNPLTRPQNMGEVATVLEKFFKCPTPIAGQPPTPPTPIFPRPSGPGPAASAAVASAPALVPLPANATAQLPGGWRPMSCDPKDVAAVVPPSPAEVATSEPRRATEATALLPPTGQVATVAATAVLPPERGSSWLAQVRQTTALIEPGSKSAPVVSLPAPTREEWSRPPLRKRSSRNRSAGQPAARESVNMPIVIISAAILLVIAAVVLLARRSPVRSTEQNQTVPAAVNVTFPPEHRTPPRDPAAPMIPAKPAQPAVAEVDAAGGNKDTGAEVRARRAQGGARRLRKPPPVSAPEPPDDTRPRRRW